MTSDEVKSDDQTINEAKNNAIPIAIRRNRVWNGLSVLQVRQIVIFICIPKSADFPSYWRESLFGVSEIEIC